MYQSDETDESGNECIRENNSSDNNTSYWDVLYKNRKQPLSVGGGLILMLISGLHIGWGIWRLFFEEPWMPGQSRPLFIFTKMSWYVTAIIGGFIGSALVAILPKKLIYFICGSILAISSSIYIIWYDEHIAILVGRCIAGLGHGIAYLTTIIHASENAAKEVRGMCVSLINVMIFVSVTISATILHTVTYTHGDVINMNSDRIIGIIGLILAVVSILYTIFLSKESVQYFLVRSKDNEALDCIKVLRSETNKTWRVTADFQELHTMIQEDRKDSKNIFTNRNGKPLVLMVVMLFLGVLTNNYLLNIILFNFLGLALGFPNFMLAPVILASVRGGLSIVSVFFADIVGRKIHITVTGISLFVAIVIAGIIFVTSPHIWLVGSFAILFQVLVAIGVDPIQHILLSEAFATSKKPFSISFVTAVENLLQILFIGMYFINAISSTDTYILVACCIFSISVVVVILLLLLPETKGLSLKEARDEFRNNGYSKHLFSGYNRFNCTCKHLR